jgi:hypothetical protein
MMLTPSVAIVVEFVVVVESTIGAVVWARATPETEAMDMAPASASFTAEFMVFLLGFFSEFSASWEADRKTQDHD